MKPVRFRHRATIVALAALPMSAPCAAVRVAPLDPEGDYLLGEWGGARARLEDRGVAFDLGYVGEAARNLSGGFREEGRLAYAALFHASVTLDLQSAPLSI